MAENRHPGLPWTAKNQGKKIMFGGLSVTVAEYGSAVGEHADISAAPFQNLSSRLLIRAASAVQNPKKVKEFYAGIGYWYDLPKKKAISWNRHVIYYGGKFAEVIDSGRRIVFAGATKLPDGTKVILILHRLQTGASTYQYTRTLIRQDPPTNNTPIDQFEFTVLTTRTVNLNLAIVNSALSTLGGSSYDGYRAFLSFLTTSRSEIVKLAVNATTLAVTTSKVVDIRPARFAYDYTFTKDTVNYASYGSAPSLSLGTHTSSVSYGAPYTLTAGDGLVLAARQMGNTLGYVVFKTHSPSATGSGGLTNTQSVDLNADPVTTQGTSIDNSSLSTAITQELRVVYLDLDTGDTFFEIMDSSSSNSTDTSNVSYSMSGPLDSSFHVTEDATATLSSTRSVTVQEVNYTVLAMHPERNLVIFLRTTYTRDEQTSTSLAGTTETATTNTSIVNKKEIMAYADGVLVLIHSSQDTFGSTPPGGSVITSPSGPTPVFIDGSAAHSESTGGSSVGQASPPIVTSNFSDNGKVLVLYGPQGGPGGQYTVVVDLTKEVLTFEYIDYSTMDSTEYADRFKTLSLSTTHGSKGATPP